ncbi:MAG TPA: DUF2961 domain-containing protein [Pseudonocardiaceae bacterium]|jgi:hypothetical protein|nr:DUF2961 domain-containing protein [Pseudonocardiaceae bacterium]
MRGTHRRGLRHIAVAGGLLGLLGVGVVALSGNTSDLGPVPDSAAPPPNYLGLDSYLHWDKLPYLEIGDRVGGQSTADPGGSNSVGNGLGSLPDGERVLFDQAGPGVATFLRMQQGTGGPWRLRQDGVDTVIGANDLGQRRPTTAPGVRFPYPLSLNKTESQGSSVVATALPFGRDLSLTSSSANGNFYSLYRKLPIDAPLPQQNADTVNRVAALLRSSASDLLPADLTAQRGTLSLAGGASGTVTTIAGSQEIRTITFAVPVADMVSFGDARLRIYWNGESAPSVDAPIGYLAGDGGGVYQPAGRPLVGAFPSDITAITGPDGSPYLRFSLYWPMPFTAGARIELASGPVATGPVSWSVGYQRFTDPPNWVGTFHANYTEIPRPTPGQDMSFLDYRGSGKLVGTVINFGAVGTTLEGDPHIYLDGSRTPQIVGTGTEEWGMGGDYWNNGRQTTLPLAGLPSTNDNPQGTDVDGAAEYRFLIADSIPFNSRIVVNWEHGGVNESTPPYRATMLWYGNPNPTAVRTDQLAASGGSGYRLDSAYEYTVTAPTVGGTMTATTGQADFVLKPRPDNVGAFLRRTFDSCVPNQRATVLVDGRFAGTWYDPGGSPRAENRCWRQEDFPLPASLTEGRDAITVTVRNAPSPSAGLPAGTVWTAADYALYSFVTA